MTLTYDEYQELGGVCDLTAFNRNIDRASGLIDGATLGRINTMREVPRQAKALCRALVEYLHGNTTPVTVTSRSQSAGGVSESESYATKTAEDVTNDVDNIIRDYLIGINNDNGVPLLYRGCAK